MELDSREVYKVLHARNLKTLYHANTVQTACLFLQQGRLLSRGTVDERHLSQTPQMSDAIDTKYGIWYDIFLDSVDIHERSRNRNFYGPVSFRFNLEVLNEDWLPSLWITKKNPTKWIDGEPASERYYTTVEEFSRNYTSGDFGSMFMLRHVGGVLRLMPHLKELVVDDPGWSYEGLDVYTQTVGALRASAWQGDIRDLKIVKRECTEKCKCSDYYTKASLSLCKQNGSTAQNGKLFFFGSAAVPPL
jgi:hypothetical protein